MASDGVWIGIDLGTSSCCAAVWDSTRGHPKWMRLVGSTPPGNEIQKTGRILPSIVLYAQDSETIVGHQATEILEKALKGDNDYDPNQVSAAMVTSIKRVVGISNLADAAVFLNSLPFQIIQSQTEGIQIQVEELGSQRILRLKPIDVLTVLLHAIRLGSNEYLVKNTQKKHLVIPGGADNSTDCLHCVIGVPAHFGQAARKVVEMAARNAGFSGHVSTITESTAAAMAYGLFVGSEGQNKSILVFDMGGGTTDVTIAEMRTTTSSASGVNEVSPENRFSVVSTQGDGRLGGDDMDLALLDFVLEKLQVSIDLSTFERRKLLHECRRAKEQLCGDVDHGLTKPLETAILYFQGQSYSISQAEFVAAIQPCLARARRVVEKAMSAYAADRTRQQSTAAVRIDEVILVGGATRVPAVRALLQDIFPAVELCLSVNAMSAVAQGAAIKAAIESQLIPLHEVKAAMMLDTCPYPIGVLVGEDHFVQVIAKDSKLPAMGYATFQLADFAQPGVSISAVEKVSGERNEFAPLGEFTFLLHRLTSDQKQRLHGVRSIDVGMTLKETGEFIVSIFDHNDPEHIRKRQLYQKADEGEEGTLSYRDQNETLSFEQILLILGCIVLFVLYVAAKMAFHEV